MARKKKTPDVTPALPELDAIRHKETRKNIPTEELRDFVADEETKPAKMLYPRDPSLDPQLVWKGKDGQDREPLEVDVVPIYIQEVIEPRVVIEAVQARKTTKPDNSGFLPGFFNDFDALDFDHKIEFYQHDQHWASRVALTLARTRLMAAKYPYYLLADSPEGLRKEAELTGQEPPGYPTANDIRKGFVYKRVPHVTLKSIANNPDIKEGMSRDEIDAAIRRHAETETLYDQPYEDKNRVRVSGPFTVESLLPDRIVSTEEERPESERTGQMHASRTDFTTMVLDNLRKAGVRNTFKNERLKFDRLESHAGSWIHATGEYTNGNGKTRRVAVTIGPEFGTVTPQQVKEAAKEAVSGVGFDILIVCGFAFDPHVSEEAKRYGKLTVLPARMNPDLLIGDTLKNTGSGNLFMVFGEPDIAITKSKDGKVTVEVKSLDVYDPTTSQIRSSSTDDIACWFIDTDYNGECFFVRHAYFCGADDPYTKLKRALIAEIDEAQWATLYSTRSYPFDPPSSGKIAVKVINHYGDEVLKVYSLPAR